MITPLPPEPRPPAARPRLLPKQRRPQIAPASSGAALQPHSPAAPALWEDLSRRDNNYDEHVTAACNRLQIGWHDPTPPQLARGSRISVVIAARNAGHTLPSVLDALAGQRTDGHVQVVVVDDASTDHTAHIAAVHPVTDIVMRLPRRAGPGCARNVGTLLATGRTIVYLDAATVLPEHVLADFGARAIPNLILVGFRHPVPHQPDAAVVLPTHGPDLSSDCRVMWLPPTEMPLPPTGLLLHPLDDTNEFRTLGEWRRYHHWDLPTMVDAALVAVPRTKVIAVGGFDPAFASGIGFEDTLLAAALIAAGCKVAPLRQACGFHLQLPETSRLPQHRHEARAHNARLYQSSLTHPRATVPLTDQPEASRHLAEGIRVS